MMKKLLVLNLKHFLKFEEIKDYVLSLDEMISSDLRVVVCPSMVYLPFFRGRFSFCLGSQNGMDVSVVGDVLFDELKGLDVSYVLLGHSSRLLTYSGASSYLPSCISSCISLGMVPIVCVGESKEDYELGKSGEVVLKQLKTYFSFCSDLSRVVVAYEPVFAIDGDMVCDLDHIREMVLLIKRNLFQVFHVNILVLYGGSIRSSFVPSLEKLDCLDGYLVGKMSNNLVELQKIMDIIS